jgi:ComF family protein
MFTLLSQLLFPSAKDTQQAVEEFSELIVFNKLDLQHKQLPYLDTVIACSEYQPSIIANTVKRWKYDSYKPAGDRLSILLNAAHSLLPSECIVSYVPIHWTRRFSRGFNQSQQLAELFCKQNKLTHQSILKRIRPTGRQAKRNRKARLTALDNAFSANECKIDVKGEIIIIIDDVFTTGSTLNECAKTLKEAGTKEVWGLVLAYDRY